MKRAWLAFTASALVALWASVASATTITHAEGNLGPGGNFGFFETVAANNVVDYTFHITDAGSSGAAGIGTIFGSASNTINILLLNASHAVLNVCGGPCSFLGVASKAFTFSGLAIGDYILEISSATEGKSAQYSGGLALAAVPLPGSLILFVSALGLGAFFVWRRRLSYGRQQQAA